VTTPAARLSAEIAISTSDVVAASAIALGVNVWKRGSVITACAARSAG